MQKKRSPDINRFCSVKANMLNTVPRGITFEERS